MQVFKYIVDHISELDSALALTEIASFVAEGTVISSISSGVALASIALFPIGALIDVVNAWQTGHKLYGMRAVAYTLTAWAFNDPLARSSPKIISNVSSGVLTRIKVIDEYEEAWLSARNATIEMITKETNRKNIRKENAKLMYRALGKNQRQSLCAAILIGFEKELNSIELKVWKSNYSIIYPL